MDQISDESSGDDLFITQSKFSQPQYDDKDNPIDDLLNILDTAMLVSLSVMYTPVLEDTTLSDGELSQFVDNFEKDQTEWIREKSECASHLGISVAHLEESIRPQVLIDVTSMREVYGPTIMSAYKNATPKRKSS